MVETSENQLGNVPTASIVKRAGWAWELTHGLGVAGGGSSLAALGPSEGFHHDVALGTHPRCVEGPAAVWRVK